MMADCFAINFASVFDSSVPVYQYPHHTCESFMPNLVITTESVATIIESIDRNSSPGSDNIHPR